MNYVKNGLILEDKCIVDQTNKNNYVQLLQSCGFSNCGNYSGYYKNFVKVYAEPENGEWWSDPDTWIIIVDQVFKPEWYLSKKEEYDKNFREEIKTWQKKCVHVGETIDEITTGYHMLKDCHVSCIKNDATVFLAGNTEIEKTCDHVTVECITDKSKIKDTCGQTFVFKMQKLSSIVYAKDETIILNMYDSAVIVHASGHTIIGNAQCSSEIRTMNEYAILRSAVDRAYIGIMQSHAKICSISNYAFINQMIELACVEIMEQHAHIGTMSDHTITKTAAGMSTISCIQDNASLLHACGCMCVDNMYNEAIIEIADEYAVIKYMRDQSEIKIARSKCSILSIENENCRVDTLQDNAMATAIFCKKNIQKIENAAMAIDRKTGKIYKAVSTKKSVKISA